MTPYAISIVLHLYCTRSPVSEAFDTTAPAFGDTMDELLLAEMISFDGPDRPVLMDELLLAEMISFDGPDRPVLTERGDAYVRALCAMPFPEKRVTWNVQFEYSRVEKS